MKIWTLTENTACVDGLAREHGLSLYIETCGKRILFDAGQTGIFADNARRMGLELSRVDLAILSHGHYDHGGGLGRFLAENDHAEIYVNQYAFEPHYNALGRDIGLDPALRSCGRLVYVEDTLALGDGLSLHSCAGQERAYPWGAFGQTAGDGRLPEDFRHEQYLLIQERGKRVVISGCSHKGVANVVSWLEPDVLIGGFHTMKLEPGSRELEELAMVLLAYPTRYYTGHCTGQGQYQVLRRIMGDRVRSIGAGSMVEI